MEGDKLLLVHHTYCNIIIAPKELNGNIQGGSLGPRITSNSSTKYFRECTSQMFFFLLTTRVDIHSTTQIWTYSATQTTTDLCVLVMRPPACLASHWVPLLRSFLSPRTAQAGAPPCRYLGNRDNSYYVTTHWNSKEQLAGLCAYISI